PPRGLHLRPIVQPCVTLASALRRQVHQIPDRIQLIDAALSDLRREPWMAAVKMPQRAVTVSGENRDRRILLSFAIFAAEIVLESAVACAEQAQSVPDSFASPTSQRPWVGRTHN